MPVKNGTAKWWRTGFVPLTAAAAVSAVGDRLGAVAMPFLLLAADFRVPEIALILGARGAGYAVVVLLGGVAADRGDGRRLMVASDTARFFIQALTLLLVVLPFSWIPALLVLQFLFGTAEGIFKPSARRMLPALVPEDELERANGLFSMTSTAGLLIGPLLAAVFALASIMPVALALDALTFGVSALLLSRLGLHGVRQSLPRERPRLSYELKLGLETVMRTPWLRLVILVSTVFHATALPAVYALGPTYVASNRNGAVDWAILVSSFGIGGLVGGLASTRLRLERPIVGVLLSLAVLAAQPLFLTASAPLATICILQGAAGMALSIFGVLQDTAEQRGLARDVLGRASSIDLFATTLAMPLGYALCAAVTASVGAESALRIIGLVSVSVCLGGLLLPASRSRVRRFSAGGTSG